MFLYVQTTGTCSEKRASPCPFAKYTCTSSEQGQPCTLTASVAKRPSLAKPAFVAEYRLLWDAFCARDKHAIIVLRIGCHAGRYRKKPIHISLFRRSVAKFKHLPIQAYASIACGRWERSSGCQCWDHSILYTPTVNVVYVFGTE